MESSCIRKDKESLQCCQAIGREVRIFHHREMLYHLLRKLEERASNERAMYELDHAKDYVMSVLKLALANVVMWTRDRYFPATYAHATWKLLAPFFHLPGRIAWGRDTVRVELRPFNVRRLTRDLVELCQRVEAAQPRLPDGRQLLLCAASVCRLTFAVQQERVA
jgi:hypothetical protein